MWWRGRRPAPPSARRSRWSPSSRSLPSPSSCSPARARRADRRNPMSDASILSLVLVGAAAVPVVWGVGAYNRLVTLRNRFRNAFSQIDIQLKRRYDLIPNLVETAKGYLRHERETLESVVAARSRALTANARAAAAPGDPQAMKDLSGAESGLAGALGRLLALAEGYPSLKADGTMLRLMEELTSTEN